MSNRLAAIAVGEPVRLTDRVVRVTAPNPGMMTGPGTNTYLVGSTDLAVIDPGPDEESHLDALVRAGGDRIRAILVTHTHVDHWPAAARLAERTGATTFGFAAKDGFEPDRLLADGDRVTLDGTTIESVHTPGHASNHLCYLLVEEGVQTTIRHSAGLDIAAACGQLAVAKEPAPLDGV